MDKNTEEKCDICDKRLKDKTIYILEAPRYNNLWMCGGCALKLRKDIENENNKTT